MQQFDCLLTTNTKESFKNKQIPNKSVTKTYVYLYIILHILVETQNKQE
jgi:hypothetical protein